mmetsp:Transcript_110078/g.355284  ORF Transcript_110078/g.355284 Transcript_110078/m.355284 type:complete len:297 (+) Transcript_110078:508-1398(+)
MLFRELWLGGQRPGSAARLCAHSEPGAGGRRSWLPWAHPADDRHQPLQVRPPRRRRREAHSAQGPVPRHLPRAAPRPGRGRALRAVRGIRLPRSTRRPSGGLLRGVGHVGGRRHLASRGLPTRLLPCRASCGGCVRCRRGAGRLWPLWQPLLGLRAAGRHAGHCHHGQAIRQWHAAGRGGDDPGRGGGLRQRAGVLQHLRREPCLLCCGAGHAGCVARGAPAGACRSRGCTPAGSAAGPSAEEAAHRRRARVRALHRHRARPGPGDARTSDAGDLRGLHPHEGGTPHPDEHRWASR